MEYYNLKNNELHMLHRDQVSVILSFIEEKNFIGDGVFNKVLRDDIFYLLESQDCIVLYYPLESEDNNGFHVKHPIHGELKKFVYINTAQFKETQIFAAAHELGHLCGIIEYMKEKGFNGDGEDNWEERIINRFAAELLMPKIEFKFSFDREFAKIEDQNQHYGTPIINVVSFITAIMNEFLTPYKSVVRRFYELGAISEESALLFLEGYDDGIIREYSKIIAKEQGYNRLYQPPDRLKYINGLKEFLDQAKKEEAMPEKWLISMYKLFDLDFDAIIDKSLSENIDIFKGGSVDAENGGH